MTDQHPPAPDAAVSRRERVRTIAAAVAGALAVLFAVLNLDEVEINWIVATWKTPLIVAIVVVFLLGAAVGAIASRRRRN